MTTRRWYYLIPAEGQPRGLVHAIERHNLDHAARREDGVRRPAAARAGLTQLLAGRAARGDGILAECAIPYLSRVDAGTAEAVRARGVEIVSSGDLVQQFEAAWTPAQLASHRAASEALYRIKDRAFDAAAAAVRGRARADRIRAAAADGAVVRRGRARSATRRRSSRSVPTPATRTTCPPPSGRGRSSADEVLLLDLWGKTREPGAVFADITWVGFTAAACRETARAFGADRRARGTRR